MKRLIVSFAAVLLVFSATSAAADSLNGQQLRKAVAGKTVLLSTPLGITLPIRYTHGGTLHGKTTKLASFIGTRQDSGQWWVSGSRLCHRWNNWLDGKSHCVTLRKEGRTLIWRANDGRSGTATVAN